MANPQIPQGTLNRIIAAVTWPDYPALNVTAPFVGREGIRLGFEGNATDFIDTLTGVVTSPAPYQRISLTMTLLKSQGLAQLYENQRANNSLLGNGNVYPDVTTLAPYSILNCGVMTVRELSFAGEDAAYAVSVSGYILTNSGLFG